MSPRITPNAPFALFDDARPGGRARLFAGPTRVITCTRVDEIPGALAAIDAAIAEGRHVAGYMAYELGYALEPKLAPLMPEMNGAPLMWMGVFDAPVDLPQDRLRALMADWAQTDADVTLGAPEIDRDTYLARVGQVREHIGAGDVYQINFTFAQPFTLTGSPLALYARLRGAQRAGYGGVLAMGARHILSLSPELFVETHEDPDGTRIRTRPMKGTAPRAANPARDADVQGWLKTDEKSRAENLMIVDLLRNDLGRISDIGTVKAESLFDVELYPTVHQMTSTVEGRLRAGTSFADVVHALFPCGSVTGAPKVKAMEIIRALEAAPRGVYTGAVGYAGPDGLRFNVAIRTLDVASDGAGVLGIGSGIVFDSESAAEWAECHLKAKFLSAPPAPFDLLETLKWSADEGFALLDRHLERLSGTAAYFGCPCDLDTVRAALEACVAGRTGAWRVRLTVDGWGTPNATAQPLTAPPLAEDGARAAWSFAFAPEPVDLDSSFTYHKTTNRAFYDDARERLSAETGCDEVVFLNARGEVAEGAITNVFVQPKGARGGELLTPPVASGLLAGTLRADLIARGKAREAVLSRADLLDAEAVFLGNSVRGLIPAKFAQK